MGKLQENPGPIPGVGLRPHRSPVGQVHQDRQPLLHNGMGLGALHMNNKSHPTGIVLKLGMVKTLGLGRMG